MILRAACLVFGLLWPALAMAHALVVFAFVDGGEVVVEAKFSNGRAAQAGTVSVFDGANTKLFDLQIVPGETTRFAVDPEAGGYLIEVNTPNGHSDYWVLTPNDLKEAK